MQIQRYGAFIVKIKAEQTKDDGDVYNLVNNKFRGRTRAAKDIQRDLDLQILKNKFIKGQDLDLYIDKISQLMHDFSI